MRGYGESEVLRGVHNYAMKKLVGKKGSFLISYYVLHCKMESCSVQRVDI